MGFLLPGAMWSRQQLNPPPSQDPSSPHIAMQQPAAAAAAFLLLATAAAAVQVPPDAQDPLAAPDIGKKAQLQQGCVLLDATGSPRFAASASACAGAAVAAAALQAANHPVPHDTAAPHADDIIYLIPAGAAAHAAFLPGQHTRGGWHQLWVSTAEEYTDEQQALALGFAEGWLTGDSSSAAVHRSGCEWHAPLGSRRMCPSAAGVVRMAPAPSPLAPTQLLFRCDTLLAHSFEQQSSPATLPTVPVPGPPQLTKSLHTITTWVHTSTSAAVQPHSTGGCAAWLRREAVCLVGVGLSAACR